MLPLYSSSPSSPDPSSSRFLVYARMKRRKARNHALKRPRHLHVQQYFMDWSPAWKLGIWWDSEQLDRRQGLPPQKPPPLRRQLVPREACEYRSALVLLHRTNDVEDCTLLSRHTHAVDGGRSSPST